MRQERTAPAPHTAEEAKRKAAEEAKRKEGPHPVHPVRECNRDCTCPDYTPRTPCVSTPAQGGARGHPGCNTGYCRGCVGTGSTTTGLQYRLGCNRAAIPARLQQGCNTGSAATGLECRITAPGPWSAAARGDLVLRFARVAAAASGRQDAAAASRGAQTRSERVRRRGGRDER